MPYLESVSPETLNERLKRLLAAARMTETEAASILGTSQAQVNRMLNGTTLSLKLVGGLRLAQRLGVSPWYLAGLTGDPQGAPMTLPSTDAEARLSRLETTLRAIAQQLGVPYDG